MPVLTNPKHELFAKALAKGMTTIDAYVFAGYAEHRPNAARLITNDNVQARVAELQQRAAIRTEVTIESLTKELEEVRARAVTIDQLAAAVGAIREKAVLNGLRIEKRETLNRYDPDKLNDADLDALIAAQLAGEPSEQEAAPGDPTHVH